MTLTLPLDLLRKSYHVRTTGDTLEPVGFQLRRRGTNKQWEWVDLTDKTVSFRMVDEEGTVVVADAPATIVEAAAGRGQYDFLPAEVADAGVYYAWAIVEDALGETSTYPTGGRRWVIVLREAA
jgi:hypothetical protein